MAKTMQLISLTTIQRQDEQYSTAKQLARMDQQERQCSKRHIRGGRTRNYCAAAAASVAQVDCW